MYESIYKRALSDFFFCLYMQHVQWMSIFVCVWGTNSRTVFIGAAWNLILYDDYDYTTSTPL